MKGRRPLPMADILAIEAEASTPPTLDVERLARAWELAGYGEVTGDIDEYQEWGGKPREIAEKVATEYARLSSDPAPGEEVGET